MDETTLSMLVDEALERAEWYGISPGNRVGETFGFGYVAGKHGLDREQTAELLKVLNMRLRQYEQRAIMDNLIQSTIRNVN